MQIKASLHFSGQFDPKSESVFWVSFLSCDGKKGNSSKEERFVISKCLDVAARWGGSTRSSQLVAGRWKCNRTVHWLRVGCTSTVFLHVPVSGSGTTGRHWRQSHFFILCRSFNSSRQGQNPKQVGVRHRQGGRLRQGDPKRLVSSRVQNRQRSKQAGSTNRISGLTTGQEHART